MGLVTQAKAQAFYMQYVAKKATESAVAHKESLAFDPQGRILVDVSLSKEDYIEILKEFMGEEVDEREIEHLGNQSIEILRNFVANNLGQKSLSPTVSVSLDVRQNSTLRVAFALKLKAALEAVGVTKEKERDHIVQSVLNSNAGSVIALQQEFHFHLSLSTHVYQKAVPEFKGKGAELNKAHQAAMLRVNGLVMKAYAKALMENPPPASVSKRNKALDKARKKISEEAHSILSEEITRHTGVIISPDMLEREDDKNYLKHTAETTTATSNDIIHTDLKNGLATFIEGTENTAHNRVLGSRFGHRQVITHPFEESGAIRPHGHPRFQTRTPSPVVKENITDELAIEDVKEKFTHITQQYSLKEILSGGGENEKPKAYIYNRFTAINDALGDINGNLQTQSAAHILKGAHAYNASQLDDENPALAFVQNISVNGFGDTLTYGSDNELLEESTLMTEIGMLHTIYDTLTPEEQQSVREIFSLYDSFLKDENRSAYFSASEQGLAAIESINSLKVQIKEMPPKESSKLKRALETNPLVRQKSVLKNATGALKQMMANNLHMGHDYAKLIQTLSLFCEQASIAGCKSGNERNQAIMGRVAVLDKLMHARGGNNIREVLADLADNKSVVQNTTKLKTLLDIAYNNAGLQTAVSMISLADQGASAKVEAKPWYSRIIKAVLSRNYGEESASTLTNLHQTKAGKMQAHKNLTAYMKGAALGQKKTWWERMKSSPLGVIGAVLGTIIIVPAIINAKNTITDNAHIDKANARLHEAQTDFQTKRLDSSGELDGLNFDLDAEDNLTHCSSTARIMASDKLGTGTGVSKDDFDIDYRKGTIEEPPPLSSSRAKDDSEIDYGSESPEEDSETNFTPL